jgi:hypothetical protein
MNEISDLALTHIFSFLPYYWRLKLLLVCKKWKSFIMLTYQNDPDKKEIYEEWYLKNVTQWDLRTTYSFSRKISEKIGNMIAYFNEEQLLQRIEISYGLNYPDWGAIKTYYADPPSYEVTFYHCDCKCQYLFSSSKVLEKVIMTQTFPDLDTDQLFLVYLQLRIKVGYSMFSKKIKFEKTYSDGTQMSGSFPVVNKKLNSLLERLDYQDWYNLDTPDIGIYIESLPCLKLPSF